MTGHELLCWNCENPITDERWKMNPMRRVFCSDMCEEVFRDWKAYMEASEDVRDNPDQPEIRP